MADPPAGKIRAAGAVVWRPDADGTQVALVHRIRYGDWSFPKGKRDPGEQVLLTAVREVAEETGLAVILGRRLAPTCYDSDGVPKRVDYWAARCDDATAAFTPNDEVDELAWLPVAAAAGRLSYPRDAVVLSEFAAAPASTVPLILLRHAEAGRKADWRHDDLIRPLDSCGTRTAQALAGLLSCFGSCRVISSPAERCLATVRPFAALTGARIESEPLFAAPRRAADRAAPQRVAADAALASRVAAIAGQDLPTVICAHGENLPLMLGAACEQLGSPQPDGPALRKGGFWVLQTSGQTLVSAEQQHSAPA